jgi:hypothetical protein
MKSTNNRTRTVAQRTIAESFCLGCGAEAIAPYNSSMGLLRNFDHIVKKRAANFLEPMGNTVGNYNHIALGHPLFFSRGDTLSPCLSRPGRPGVFRMASGDQEGGTFKDVKDVRILSVYFDFARAVAAQSHYFEIVRRQDRTALCKCRGYFVMLQVDHSRTSRFIRG